MKFEELAKLTQNTPNPYGYSYDKKHWEIVNQLLKKLQNPTHGESFEDVCLQHVQKLQENGKKSKQ